MSSSIRIVVGVSVLVLLLLFRKGVSNRVRGVEGKERVWIVAYLCRYSTRKTHRCVFCWKVTHPIAQFRSFLCSFFSHFVQLILFSPCASPFNFRSARTCIFGVRPDFFLIILFMCEKLVVFRFCFGRRQTWAKWSIESCRSAIKSLNLISFSSLSSNENAFSQVKRSSTVEVQMKEHVCERYQLSYLSLCIKRWRDICQSGGKLFLLNRRLILWRNVM